MTRRALLSMLAAVPFVGTWLTKEKRVRTYFGTTEIVPGDTITFSDTPAMYTVSESFIMLGNGDFYVWRDGAWVKRG